MPEEALQKGNGNLKHRVRRLPAALPTQRCRPVSGLTIAAAPPSRVQETQWLDGVAVHSMDWVPIAYRCGGSTGLGRYAAPVSRFTGVPAGSAGTRNAPGTGHLRSRLVQDRTNS